MVVRTRPAASISVGECQADHRGSAKGAGLANLERLLPQGGAEPDWSLRPSSRVGIANGLARVASWNAMALLAADARRCDGQRRASDDGSAGSCQARRELCHEGGALGRISCISLKHGGGRFGRRTLTTMVSRLILSDGGGRASRRRLEGWSDAQRPWRQRQVSTDIGRAQRCPTTCRCMAQRAARIDRTFVSAPARAAYGLIIRSEVQADPAQYFRMQLSHHAPGMLRVQLRAMRKACGRPVAQADTKDCRFAEVLERTSAFGPTILGTPPARCTCTRFTVKQRGVGDLRLAEGTWIRVRGRKVELLRPAE